MIPPHELKNKEFTRVVRGYSIPEVDEYISFVMEKYTELYRENDALERKLQSALDSLEAMHAEEESVRTALINAQKAGKKIVADASDRADKIMRSAKSDCLRVLAEFRDKAAAERKTLLELKTSAAALKEELLAKYQANIEALENLSPATAAEVAAMERIDNDVYAQKLSDGIEELVKEDFGVDLHEKTTQKDEANADTQVFDRIDAEMQPQIRHVTLSDDPLLSDKPVSPSSDTSGFSADSPLYRSAEKQKKEDSAQQKKGTGNQNDVESVLRALSADMGENPYGNGDIVSEIFKNDE